MPEIPAYRRPWPLFNAHLETIWPSLFRKVVAPLYRRERIATPDGDFLDLDWLQTGCADLAILSHGLEGDSRRHYVVGMANAMAACGWDVLAWNFRGCGGEANVQPRFTHNGSTGDLDEVVRHALASGSYRNVVLIGFSMGGNLTLVYLGRDADRVPGEVRAAVVFSVPCDLAESSVRLAEPGNTLYMKRFLYLMGRKVRRQARRFPDLFPLEGYRDLRNFTDFDDRYTAPLHGFASARHYWEECSSLRYLERVCVPSWIVNARNDPFLGPNCFPQGGRYIRLVAPEHGGHCGFSTWAEGGPYWSERLATFLLSEFRMEGRRR